MKGIRLRRPSPAQVIPVVALFVALGGAWTVAVQNGSSAEIDAVAVVLCRS